MPDRILRLIPTSPAYVPHSRAQQTAKGLLASFLSQTTPIHTTVSQDVIFVDPGKDLTSIACPLCQTPIEFAWWQQAMESAYAHRFADLAVTLPCCGARASLNDLRYDGPAGFAKFMLEAHDPPRELQERSVWTLEQTLGCNLRTVWYRA